MILEWRIASVVSMIVQCPIFHIGAAAPSPWFYYPPCLSSECPQTFGIFWWHLWFPFEFVKNVRPLVSCIYIVQNSPFRKKERKKEKLKFIGFLFNNILEGTLEATPLKKKAKQTISSVWRPRNVIGRCLNCLRTSSSFSVRDLIIH